MATEVNLPELGESVTEGTVTRWLKQVGDEVAVDEALLEVSTDKVDTEIPSPVAGTLLEIRAQEDDTVEVGAVLGVIGASDEASGDSSGGSDEGGQADSAPEPEPEPEPTQAETPLEEEQNQRDQAHEQAERADSPAEPAESAESPAEEPAAAPADEAAPSSDGGSDGGPDGARDDGSDGGGESTTVNLPELGESVTEGTVTRWLKQVGDQVAADESLLEVSTDKVDTEIPSPVSGTLLEIKVNEDETVEVGAALAVIGSGAGGSGGGESASAPAEETPAEPEQPEQPPRSEQQEQQEPAAPEPEAASEEAPAPEQGQPQPAAETAAPAAAPSDRETSGYVTPLVRKMAAQHGVDLATLVGTGVGGRIRKQDVLDAAAQQGTDTAPSRPAAAAAAAAAPAAPATAGTPAAPAAPAAPAQAPAPAASGAPSPLRGKTEPMSRLRKVIASRMVESLQTMAQLTTVVEVDVTAISRLRDAEKADFATREGVKLSYMPFFAKAAVDALKEHPSLNAAIDTEKGEVTYYDRENLAIAVDTERGLLTPVIKEAGDLSIAGLARKIADVAERTRTNKITPDELSGGTFTITNTGSRGALFDTPIINLPQVAILGTGSVVKRAVVIDDPNLGETIAVRQMVYLALTYDHRLVDGADAARFLTDVKGRLEAGQFEV